MFFSLSRIFPLFGCICTLFLLGCSPFTEPGSGLGSGFGSDFGKSSGSFRVYFLDVGQGDACLLRTPANHFFLYDIGNEERYLLSFLRHVKADTLDGVFISHPELDHFGAFQALYREIPIKKVYLPVGTSSDPTWQDVLRTLDAFKGGKGTLFAGDTLIWDGAVHVRALWPYSRASFTGNNLSVVLRVEYASHAVLLTGDVENQGETGMLAAGSHLGSDILKVAHHGSRTSNGLPFLSAVAPKWAVISCDSTVYGHPHPEAVADLKFILGDSTRILRTDRVGTIAFDIDANGIRRLTENEF